MLSKLVTIFGEGDVLIYGALHAQDNAHAQYASVWIADRRQARLSWRTTD